VYRKVENGWTAREIWWDRGWGIGKAKSGRRLCEDGGTCLMSGCMREGRRANKVSIRCDVASRL
jgi:hypothetical protein